MRPLMCLIVFASAACAYRIPPGGPPLVASESSVVLHGHALRLHLSKPAAPSAARPLLVYTTGDGGWWRGDRDLFTHLTTWGYPAVGLSAREYVHHLEAGPILPAEVAENYRSIIDAAIASLGLAPDTRAILVGKSRGAGLSVAAALNPRLNATLAGVLAVGLTREEEYVHGRVRGSKSRELAMFQTYARLADIGAVPVAVIQSTHDRYVPAREARELFGIDTASREFIAIDSRDHNFDGASDRLLQEMERALDWMANR